MILFRIAEVFLLFSMSCAYSPSLKVSTLRTRIFGSLSAVVDTISKANQPITESRQEEMLLRPSITDLARTITHICTSGTLSTISVNEDISGVPFGSYVDYILDDKGSPVMLLSNKSMHTQNIIQNQRVSLFCLLPRSQYIQSAASLSRVTLIGKIELIPPEDIFTLKLAFTLVHPYTEQIVDSPKFKFYKIIPEKIYFSGGFGVMATWVDVDRYMSAKPDVLAQEVSHLLSKINSEKQEELSLVCKHILGISDADSIRIQATDRLGIDIRVQRGEFTDEYRIGFRHSVHSAEDAKSEIMKLFQEAWERSNGGFSTEELPPVLKYAEDILRKK